MSLASKEIPRIAVVVSSLGRPECLETLWRRLITQTHRPHRIVFSVTETGDVPKSWEALIDRAPDKVLSDDPEVVIARKGLPSQRNHGMDRVLGDSDIVVFLDDDYVPSKYALAGVARAFEVFPDLAGLTGKLLADGIGGPGIEPDLAVRTVEEWDNEPDALSCASSPKKLASRMGLYGCNMAFRTASIGDIRFDERLPLYGWLEDIDFSSRIPGPKIVTDGFIGVHCGVKRGREKRGDRLGYSQIVNPFYLWKKGSIQAQFGLKLSCRNFLSNHAKLFWPEPWIDRRGRVRGNWCAIRDLCLGKASPEKILSLR
ncbi:MAG: glycosyltransferase [Pseudomonadota bacterium]